MNEIEKNICRKILTMHYRTKTSHVGSALSVVPILYDIYFNKFRHGDKVILSKAHASTALYATLVEKGLLSDSILNEYPNGNYKEHCVKSQHIDYSGGSLGMGLSFGMGLAISLPMNNVYVILGDGELQEGNIYEAMNHLNKLYLPNLYVYIDYNRLQGYTDTKVPMYDYPDNVQIVHTTKGNGVSFMRNELSWHYKTMTEDQYNKAMREIDER